MNENNNSIQYLVPSNVSAKFEFFTGFGWSEFRIVLVATFVGFLIFSFLGLFTKIEYIPPEDAVNLFAETDGVTFNDDGSANRVVNSVPLILRVITVIVPSGSAFMLVKKDPNNGQSLLTLLKSFLNFRKKQKRYLYVYNSGSEVK